MKVAELKDILVREGYGDIAADRSIRKAELVAYVENLIDHRHGEALESNAKRDEMATWYASFEVKEESTKVVSTIEVVSPTRVKCIICPMTWKVLAEAINHDHECPEGFELYEFEGQGMFVDSIGMPISTEKGFRCGECKTRHHSIKAIKLCHEMAADHKAEAEAEYRAMMAETRYYENRGAEEAIAQDAYEARMGVVSFTQAWHNESPETCPCCN